jgi:thiol:disulfide interchange protein
LWVLALAGAAVVACSLGGGATAEAGRVDEIAADESPAPDAFSLVVLHPPQGDLPALLAAHAERAAEMERRPFVEFTASWCPSCVLLERSLDDERMIEAFRGTYIMRMDIDEWKSRLGRTDYVVLGVPAFFEVGTGGEASGRSITGAAWGPDIPENMAPVLREFFGEGAEE